MNPRIDAMRSIHLHQPEDAMTMSLCGPTSTSPTHIEITDVPDEIPTTKVILTVSGLVFWPWPTKPVPWSRIAEKPQGSIVRDL
jgi:hypothetical protein